MLMWTRPRVIIVCSWSMVVCSHYNKERSLPGCQCHVDNLRYLGIGFWFQAWSVMGMDGGKVVMKFVWLGNIVWESCI
jgi:hypothetical protein